MADTDASKQAHAAAREAIAKARQNGETRINFNSDAFRALNRIPPELADVQGLTAFELDNTAITDLAPLQGMTGLQRLSFNQTAITDLSPLSDLTNLRFLYCSKTKVSDLSPLKRLTKLIWLNLNETLVNDLSALQGMTELLHLSFNQTEVSDLSPLTKLTALRSLSLYRTKVRDLRPALHMPRLGSAPYTELSFFGTPAADASPQLWKLSLSGYHRKRTRETIAYLKTLPPWPEPLPGDEPPAQPAPDPAVPLQHDDGVIALASAQITAAERDDPIRETLHAVLQDQVNDLIRVSGNIDEAAYTQTCKLRDLLEVGLLLMNPLLVHLALEALRRIRAKTGAEADRDFLLAIEAVIETGPGLTLDTREVQLFVDRAQRNRIERLAEAQAEAQIRLAQSIADSGLSAVDLQAIARRAADESVYDQFTAIRPTLARNYTLEVGKWALVAIASGPMGEAGTLAVQWLAANAADIRSMASVWGEPFAVWIAPILEKAQQCVDGAKHLLNKHRKP